MYSSSLSRTRYRAIYFITLATVLSQSDAELIAAPRNTESKVGDTTYFNCTTDVESHEIFWHHGNNYIYIGDTILEPYRGRFEIDRNASNGSHNLVINSVEPGDAGKYICIDDDGLGTRRSAELVVLENDPDCQSNIQSDGVIGQNIFNIPPDEIQLTCNVTYRGSIPPEMEWKKLGDYNSIENNVTYNFPSNNRVIYTLALEGDIALNDSSYVCQTRRSTKHQYKCASAIVKVLYFLDRNLTEQSVVRGDKITCSVKHNSFPCINQWYIGNNSCPLSCDETITTHSLGEYLCVVKCNVRGTDYSFKAMKAIVVEMATSPPPSTSGKIAAAVLVPILIVIFMLVALIVALTVRYKRNKTVQRIQRAENIQRLLDFRNSGEQEKRNEVAETEIQLLYKIKKDATSDEHTILGVAMLGEKLFIVRENRPTLEVYDFDHFLSGRHILEVNGLIASVDICSCKKNDCLYILDKKTGRTPTKVLTIRKDGTPMRNWPVKNNASGYLSATGEGNVIITVQDKRMLLEYSSNGKLVRDVKLPDCINPWHAIQLADGRYVVSHGTLIDRFNRVCLVNSKGNVEEFFGREAGSAEDQLNTPFYLAVGNNGCIMVADLFNNRVLSLDSNLKLKTKIVAKHQQRFRNPRRIYLHERFLVVVITAGDSKKTMSPDVDKARAGAEDDDSSKENDDLLRKTGKRKMSNVDASQLIEDDCRLLVFNIQPLLQQ